MEVVGEETERNLQQEMNLWCRKWLKSFGIG